MTGRNRTALRALLLCCAIAGAASAGPITPPKAWVTDPATARSLADQLRGVPHFGGAPSIVTTEAYRAPGGGALYLTRVVATVKPEDRDRAATVELGEPRAALERQGGAVKPEVWTQSSNPDPKQLEATLQWTDAATGVANTSRAVIAADSQMLAAVTGECVLPATSPPELMTVCRAALATLDPGIAPASRVVLAIAGAPATSEQPILRAGSAARSPEPSRLGDGGAAPSFPPMAIAPAERETDKRPIYLGGGLVILAAVFWWNRKQREKFEREDRAGRGEPAPAPPSSADPDADDLHAAAQDPTEDKQS